MAIENDYNKTKNLKKEICGYKKCKDCECFFVIEHKNKQYFLKNLLDKFKRLNNLDLILDGW